MSYVLYLVLFLVFAITTYIIVEIVRAKASLQDLVPTMISLNTSKQILDSGSVKSTLLTTSGSTIAGFINVSIGNRTASIGNTDNAITLLGVSGSFLLQIQPISNKNNQLSTYLKVYTTNTSQNNNIEIINLPPFPQQKWIFVSILRDGRRFDVMYNDEIVASHRLFYYPSVISNPLTIGSKELLGNTVYMLVAPYRLTPSDISVQRAKLADTNGEPQTQNMFLPIPTQLLPMINLQTVCIPGLTCNPTTEPPSDHLKAWSTPYA